MASKDRILTVLNEATGPVCDDCLPPLAMLSSRQVAYIGCEDLAARGKINRASGSCVMCGKIKKVSWTGVGMAAILSEPLSGSAMKETTSADEQSREGKIELSLLGHLAKKKLSNRDKVLGILNESVGAICDNCLTKLAGLKRSQITYMVCEGLAVAGKINRSSGSCTMCGKTKKVNWSTGTPDGAAPAPATDSDASKGPPPDGLPWYWEGKIQSKLLGHLVRRGYYIRAVADTASRAQGKDIIAVGPDGKELWVTVKGFPEKSANTQARHWFAGALLDLILYRDENADVNLALALPDGYATYANLAPRTSWLRNTMPFKIYWVSESGGVRED